MKKILLSFGLVLSALSCSRDEEEKITEIIKKVTQAPVLPQTASWQPVNKPNDKITTEFSYAEGNKLSSVIETENGDQSTYTLEYTGDMISKIKKQMNQRSSVFEMSYKNNKLSSVTETRNDGLETTVVTTNYIYNQDGSVLENLHHITKLNIDNSIINEFNNNTTYILNTEGDIKERTLTYDLIANLKVREKTAYQYDTNKYNLTKDIKGFSHLVLLEDKIFDSFEIRNISRIKKTHTRSEDRISPLAPAVTTYETTYKPTYSNDGFVTHIEEDDNNGKKYIQIFNYKK